MPKQRAMAPQQIRRRLPSHVQRAVAIETLDVAAQSASDQATVDADSSRLLAEAEAEVETENATVTKQRSFRSGYTPSGPNNKWEPQFLNPLPLGLDGASCTIEDREAFIEEELEVLKSIYGDDAISWTQSKDDHQRPCWQIHVEKLPWHLHLLIPGDLPYPKACPLLCPQMDDQRFTVEQAERLVAALGATAQRHLGEAFIFDLVESLEASA